MTYPCWETVFVRDGVEVVAFKRLGHYQGDMFIVIRRGHMFGWIDLNYGSCSGCDALEACEGDQGEIKKVVDRIIGSVDWKSKKSLLQWIDERDWQAQPGFYVSDEDLKDRTDAVATLRQSLVEARP